MKHIIQSSEIQLMLCSSFWRLFKIDQHGNILKEYNLNYLNKDKFATYYYVDDNNMLSVSTATPYTYFWYLKLQLPTVELPNNLKEIVMVKAIK